MALSNRTNLIAVTLFAAALLMATGAVAYRTVSDVMEPTIVCQTYELHGVGIIGPPWIVDGHQVVGVQQFAKLTCKGYAEIEVDDQVVRVPVTRILHESGDLPPRLEAPPAQVPGLQAQGL